MGITNYPNGVIFIRICGLDMSNLSFSCPDICHIAAHEFAHWTYCYTGGIPAQNACQQLAIEIGAERHAYNTCLANPYPDDSECKYARQFMEWACNQYKKSRCPWQWVKRFCTLPAQN